MSITARVLDAAHVRIRVQGNRREQTASQPVDPVTHHSHAGASSAQPQTLARPNPCFPTSFLAPVNMLHVERSAPQPGDRAVPKGGPPSATVDSF